MVKEDKIKKPDGTVLARSNIVAESINYYKQAYQENLTDICDFSEGSEIRTLHESLAVDVFSLYKEMYRESRMKFVIYATGNYLDALACEYNLQRKSGEVAKGSVTFSTSATLTSSIFIPRGTVILARHTGYEYILQNDVVVTATDTPVNGEVYSKLVGEKYNVGIGKLTAFANIQSVRSDLKVTNNTPIVGGMDEENDEEFRTRILSAKRELAHGTASSYSNLIINNVPEVHDIAFVPPELLLTDEKYARHYKDGIEITDTYQRWTNSGNIRYDDDKKPIVKTLSQLISDDLLCTKCASVLFVNSHGKPCSDEIISDVEYVMTQQNNLVVSQSFHIEKAQCIPLYLSIELFVLTSVDEKTIVECLTAYFDGGTVETKIGEVTFHGLNMGETIYKSRLIDVLEAIPGVYQVGDIKQAKYDKTIPTDILQWNNNGKAGFTYEDDDGYVYSRSNSEVSAIKYWGKKNFVSLETHEGSVFQLGLQMDIDSSALTDLDLNLVLVDANGNVSSTGEVS